MTKQENVFNVSLFLQNHIYFLIKRGETTKQASPAKVNIPAPAPSYSIFTRTSLVIGASRDMTDGLHLMNVISVQTVTAQRVEAE